MRVRYNDLLVVREENSLHKQSQRVMGICLQGVWLLSILPIYYPGIR